MSGFTGTWCWGWRRAEAGSETPPKPEHHPNAQEGAVVSESADRPVQSVTAAIEAELKDCGVARVHPHGDLYRNGVAHDICLILGLDPDTVFDGPLVVLHPGQHVVTGCDGEGRTDPEGVTVVASGPEVGA